MEKQISKKIKMFQFDYVGQHKDQFLQFGQNNGIGIHFTVGKYGVAKEMNCSLLQKVRYLMSNVSLNKVFWAEVLVYACHPLNYLS